VNIADSPVVYGRRHTIKLTDVPNDTPTEKVQIFVFSYRSKKWYPQANLERTGGGNATCSVVLGDENAFFGLYGVMAMVVPSKVSQPIASIPSSWQFSNIVSVRRIGR
jgi:hypothetical protein